MGFLNTTPVDTGISAYTIRSIVTKMIYLKTQWNKSFMGFIYNTMN